MFHLPRGASAEDAYSASGLGSIEWSRFKIIARNRAEECVVKYPNTIWRHYTAAQQTEVVAQINDELASEGVRRLEEDVVEWKMAILTRDVLKAEEKKKRDQIGQSGTACGDGKETTVRRVFDPIREI